MGHMDRPRDPRTNYVPARRRLRPFVTERVLRPIGAIADHRDQLRKFNKLVAWVEIRRSKQTHIRTHNNPVFSFIMRFSEQTVEADRQTFHLKPGVRSDDGAP